MILFGSGSEAAKRFSSSGGTRRGRLGWAMVTPCPRAMESETGLSSHIIAFRGVTPDIAPDCFIAPNAAIIGAVTIGAGSSIWFSCVLRGDVNAIRIGRNSNLQDGTVVHVGDPPHSVSIGDNVLIGHLAMIHGCTIEDGAFIGMQSMVLDGAVIEKGAFVAAGSLVPPGKRVTAGHLWAGRPARPIRKLTEKDLHMLAVGAPHYVALAQEFRQGETDRD